MLLLRICAQIDRLDPDGNCAAEDYDYPEGNALIRSVSGRWRMDQTTMHGGVGDPRPSTAAAGKAMIEASIQDVSAPMESYCVCACVVKIMRDYFAGGEERARNQGSQTI